VSNVIDVLTFDRYLMFGSEQQLGNCKERRHVMYPGKGRVPLVTTPALENLFNLPAGGEGWYNFVAHNELINRGLGLRDSSISSI
jgi:hypothetical protein